MQDDGWLAREFGARLRSVRQQRDVNQELLGKRAGVSRTSIVNIERGRQGVSLITVYRLAEALRVAPADLLPASPVDGAVADAPVIAIGGKTDASTAVVRDFLRDLDEEPMDQT